MKNQVLIKLGIGIFILAIALTSCLPEVGNHVQTYEEEMQLLNAYITGLETEGENVDTTALGVYYLVLEESEGDYPQTGDTITISYRGYLMDGQLFDNSAYNFEDGEWTFVLGETQTIAGWEDGMRVVNEGAKVQLMITSDLGYGENGYGSVPPNNTLIFVIEMIDIKPTS